MRGEEGSRERNRECVRQTGKERKSITKKRVEEKGKIEKRRDEEAMAMASRSSRAQPDRSVEDMVCSPRV